MKTNAVINKGEVVLYKNRLEVRLDHNTVWLSQKRLAELFDTERSVITKHISLRQLLTPGLDKSPK